MTRRSLLFRAADSILLSGEVFGRQVYWRMPWLRKALKRFRRVPTGPIQEVQRGELRDFLREIGVVEGGLVMAHTSVTNLRIIDPKKNPAPEGFLAVAKTLVDDLVDLVGPAGTVLMPTNPGYQTDDLERTAAERDAVILSYDPQRTPCAVGMANEVFWRRKGAVRSLHPFNPLAANGPLAEELLRNNLNFWGSFAARRRFRVLPLLSAKRLDSGAGRAVVAFHDRSTRCRGGLRGRLADQRFLRETSLLDPHERPG